MTATTKRRPAGKPPNPAARLDPPESKPAVDGRRPQRAIAWLLVAVAILAGGAAVWLQLAKRPRGGLGAAPVDGQRAYRFLKEICDLGPRPSGSPAMLQQQALIEKHFQQLGADVKRQSFQSRHPVDGSAVTMMNLIASWHPQRTDRVLVCCHYDTRPYPDQDRRQPRGRFVGANDGASGAAVMLELAHYMKSLPGPIGVDFVLFDGEEFVFSLQDSTNYFKGSTHFAQAYQARQSPAYRYRCGVLLDMVGDRELHLYYERNSMRYPQARKVALEVWATARRLGVDEFVARTRHEVRDDHLPLNDIAKIPTCDVIDFDYPRPGRVNYWHTVEDTPDKCSAESLAKVSWVLLEWLRGQQ